jgi:hypothetical protein
MSQYVGFSRTTRRVSRALRAFVAVLLLCASARISAAESNDTAAATGDVPAAKLAQHERWGMIEVELKGPSEGNPFVDVELDATFENGNEKKKVTGFYDGDGVYRVRFMPSEEGNYRYTTHSNVKELDGKTGEIEVGPPTNGNHGPVQVRNAYHFAYADGSPYRQLGTTCYAWTSQDEQLQEQTLKTLAASPFNKLRMCVFPKWYTWNEVQPAEFAFVGKPNDWDYSQFNPKFFQQFERRIAQLRDMGIEADIILLHPYDEGQWGFDRMPDEVDDRYLRYIVSRLAAFRNVWWSLANEYDFMKEKQQSDWDRMIQVVHDAEPYGRLTSIHNGRDIYNHTNPLLTHASIQNGSAAEDAGRAVLYRDVYHKPIVFDEIKYEGDIPLRWGNLSAEEMVHRFWECIIAGTYPGHGECYLHPSDVLWWSKGGVLRGESPARIAFLRDILATSPAGGIDPIDKWQVPNVAGKAGEYYLVYFGAQLLDDWKFQLPRQKRDDPKELAGGMKFQVDVLDTWNMTIEPIEELVEIRQPAEADYVVTAADDRVIRLPHKPWLALRITRVDKE